MDQKPRRLSLRWKIGGTFTGVMLVLGIFVVAIVYQLTQRTLRDQLDRRVWVIANNLGDAAAGHIIAGNILALNVLARKYTLLDGVAYVFIEDATGEILVHTLGGFPEELRQEPPVKGERQAHRREVSLGGKAVYETSVPVLEGQAGNVHVGFWHDAVQKEIQRAVFPLIAILAVVPLVGALLAFVLAHWIVIPIVGLTQVADKVTMGDLETSVSGECVRCRDEIGELARSLERMRSSLKAAMLRLGRETA
jgi:two-component system sensor histidine kinase VicK